MALVGEIVARFRADTDQWIQKTEELKQKNRAVAQDLLKSAGDADRAIKSLQVARNSGALKDYGIDPRQVAGVIGEIKSIAREAQDASEGGVKSVGEGLAEWGKQGKAVGHVMHGLEQFASGNVLTGVGNIAKGLVHVREAAEGIEGPKFGNSLFGVGLGITAIGIVAHVAAEATEKAAKLTEELREGNLSTGEMVDKFVRMTPIVGDIWATGRNIREVLGIENDELEKQIDLQNRLNEVRKKAVEIAQEAARRAKDDSNQTADIRSSTESQRLKLQGYENQAKAKDVADQAAQQKRNFEEQTARDVADAQRKLRDQLELPAKEGDKSLSQQAKDASDAAAKARDELATATAELNRSKQALDELKNAYPESAKAGFGAGGAAGSAFGPGGGKIYEQFQKLEDAAKEAEKKVDAAHEKLKDLQPKESQLTSAVRSINAQIRDIAEEGKKSIEERNQAIDEAAKAQGLAAFGGKDPRALDLAGAFKKNVASFSGAIADNPVTEWIDRQLAMPLKGESLSQWIKGQVDAGAKSWDKFKEQQTEQARQIHEQVQTPAESLRDKLAAAASNKSLSPEDLTRYYNLNLRDLMAQKSQLEEGRPVYQLPDVKDVRGGSLYVPQSVQNKEQIEKLQQIIDAAALLHQDADKNGINLQVIE